MESKTQNTQTTDSQPSENEPLSISTRVVDRLETDEETSYMRVIESDVGPANEVTAGTGGLTIWEYEDNKQFPADDSVVRVVFEKDLDNRITDWEEHTDRLGDYLDEFAEEWSVDVNRYGYPRSRLKIVSDPVIDD